MKKLREEIHLDDLNLVPIMGLIVILIPMLLLMVVFTQIGVININAPKLSVGPASDDPEEPDKKPLNLTIGISEKGYTIAATGGILPGQAPAAAAAAPGAAVANPGPTLPSKAGGPCDGPGTQPDKLCGDGNGCPKQCGDGNVCRNNQCIIWDYPALYTRLVEIKEAYPDESLVNMGADDTVKFGTLVATMDAIRVRLIKDSYPEFKDFETADFKRNDDGAPELLFSDVVMAVIQ